MKLDLEQKTALVTALALGEFVEGQRLPPERELAAQIGDIGISSITLSELHYGVAKSQHQEKNANALNEFIIPLEVVGFDEAAAHMYGEIRAALEKAGVASSKRNASDSPPIEIKIPEGDKRSEYMQVMCDLNVLAFQTDTTRVSTYIGSTPNGVSYPELGFKDEHHSQTHHNNKPDQVAKVAAITAFNISQFAYMVKKMATLREGDGTLLDNCIMMWGSGLEDGNTHNRVNLPFIIAGKGGGSINTGRFLADSQGNQGDLLSTILACAGIPLDRPIGIATKQVKEMIL